MSDDPMATLGNTTKGGHRRRVDAWRMKWALPFSLLLVLATAESLFAQGSLTPPGAPGATMKSLDQIESRTAISSVPYTITQSGSYYLTKNLAVSSGDAIAIEANGVTLDLNGFTISSTAASANGTAIVIGFFKRNIRIINGFVESGVTQSGGGFTGGGFANGITFSGSTLRNAAVSNVGVRGVLGQGINLGFEGTVVEGCTVEVAGGTGIIAAAVNQCTARECGFNGITGIQVQNSFGLAITSGSGIQATNALNCFGYSFASGKGIDAYSAENCRGQAVGDDDGIGINAHVANNCTGWSDNGTGINADSAINCYAEGGVYALDAGFATNCFARSTTFGGTGIRANLAQNCQGTSSHSTNSFDGITAFIAIGCLGTSTSGTGLHATIGNSCLGSTFSGTALSVAYKYNMPP